MYYNIPLRCWYLVLLIHVVSSSGCNDVNSEIPCLETRTTRSTTKDFEPPMLQGPVIQIIPIPSNYTDRGDGRSNDADMDDSIMGRVSRFMRTHEVKIRVGDLLDKVDFKEMFGLTPSGMDDDKDVFEGRKKDKGMGIVLMMGMMMAKMMAVLGIGGVGALAMKALAVSSIALLLAGIIGIKKLAESSQSDSSHHRKRRYVDEDMPLPYRGWSHYTTN